MSWAPGLSLVSWAAELWVVSWALALWVSGLSLVSWAAELWVPGLSLVSSEAEWFVALLEAVLQEAELLAAEAVEVAESLLLRSLQFAHLPRAPAGFRARAMCAVLLELLTQCPQIQAGDLWLGQMEGRSDHHCRLQSCLPRRFPRPANRNPLHRLGSCPPPHQNQYSTVRQVTLRHFHQSHYRYLGQRLPTLHPRNPHAD